MNPAVHVRVRLVGIIVAAEVLTVVAIAATVRQDARIRATIAYGEIVVTAIQSYSVDRGTAPVSLAELVPRYLSSVPQPLYGTDQWSYSRGRAGDSFSGDDRRSVELRAAPIAAFSSRAARSFTFAVATGLSEKFGRVERRSDGCWQLPEFPACWWAAESGHSTAPPGERSVDERF
jgi:hypothetical protein